MQWRLLTAEVILQVNDLAAVNNIMTVFVSFSGLSCSGQVRAIVLYPFSISNDSKSILMSFNFTQTSWALSSFCCFNSLIMWLKPLDNCPFARPKASEKNVSSSNARVGHLDRIGLPFSQTTNWSRPKLSYVAVCASPVESIQSYVKRGEEKFSPLCKILRTSGMEPKKQLMETKKDN